MEAAMSWKGGTRRRSEATGKGSPAGEKRSQLTDH